MPITQCLRPLLLAVLLAAYAVSGNAAWRTLGAVERVQTDPEQVEFATASGAHVRIGFVAADTVRVRMSPGGSFARDASYALAAAPAMLPLRSEGTTADEWVALQPRAGGLRVRVRTRPQFGLAILDGAGARVLQTDPARPIAFDPDTGAVAATVTRAPFELYYGFGEKALPLSRQGQSITMWNSDTPRYASGTDPLYQDIPFFIALRDGISYGVFLDNTWRTTFDMGKTDPARYTFGAAGGDLDWYVFGGGAARSPAAVLAGYAALTGHAPLPPLWALGYQQSRYSYTPAARVREIAQGFRTRRIPADTLYLDIDYMDGYRVFSWSPTAFPHPEALLAELRGEDFHLVTIIDPGVKVDDGYPIYRDGRARGVFVRDAAGDELHAKVWPGLCAFPDFTDARARHWFGSLYATFLDQGVSGFWNDMNEPATFVPDDSSEPILVHDPRKTFPLDAQHAGDGQPGTHARYHNVYGEQMARTTWEGVRRLRPQRRPFVLTRAGYAGVQRYAAVWTGDNVASWEHLALTIPMLTNLSVSGVPFVGADVGGFVGSPPAELYARWLQAAALTPLFRTHAEIGSADREPWSYGARYEAINRATIELRYRLLPYLYTLFAAQEQRGEAILRPLWFDYPRDPGSRLVDDEFLLGADLLVAPVLRGDATRRRVYFPAGADWIDWWDGTRHAGGSKAEIDAPLERLPLFVRAGAALPVQPVVQDTAEMAHAPLTIVVGAGADGGGTVYEDGGDGYGYRRGEARTSHVAIAGNRITLAIPRARRLQRIVALELVGIEAMPRAVRIDGRRAKDVQFDAATRRLRIALPDEAARRVDLESAMAPAAMRQ